MLDILDMSLQATQTLCLHYFYTGYMDKVLKSFMVTMFLKGHVHFVKINVYTYSHEVSQNEVTM